MSDNKLRDLVKMAGGRRRFLAAVEEAWREAGGNNDVPITVRMINSWRYEHGRTPPTYVLAWILAGCIKRGMTAKDAIAVYPPLDEPFRLSSIIAEKAA